MGTYSSTSIGLRLQDPQQTGIWRTAFREFVWTSRPVLLVAFSLVFALVATYRNFGFDLEGGGLRDLYPYIADGWGIWYWFAHAGLSFNPYLFILNLILSAEIFMLAFPQGQKHVYWSVSIVIVLYLELWFLFGQSRYGMALALIAPAAVSESVVALLILGAIASLIHKAVAGGVVLLIVWQLLRRRSKGLSLAVILCACATYVVQVLASTLLIFAGYANYLNWESLPGARTPWKYYYIIAVLLLWKFRDKRANRLLILALLFLPLSYFIVFAGRSFQMFSVVFLFCLVQEEMPGYIRVLLLIPYLADLTMLVFSSGLYL